MVAITSSSTVAAIIILVAGLLLLNRRRQARELKCAYSSCSSQIQRRLLFQGGPIKRKFKWDDIMKATNNLSDAYVIGSGGSGMVYKAELPTGETVAVKKILRKDDLLLYRSFVREMQTLGRIRHRHLVKLMGCCSNKGAGSNMLIMSTWRMEVYGIGCISHCCTDSNPVSPDLMDTLLQATEKSNVYSMGIVLMELVSRRMPTDETFGADVGMVRWVESRIDMSSPAREELVDSALQPLLPNEESAIFQVLDIALECTRTSPAERLSSR
ncbi:hypothetical protein IFM89_005545 [Coptis chinensis]|uniref:non-specific serine/threonine protein kinase n=1 Tax=Coptis chinensis TaxID=261450 RepID=A0A835H6W4_9MAGN|nr:hypothetical protein IFM89_005545 [Coptis chinensis]